MDISNDQIKLSIILACRNEEQALGLCLKKIQEIIALSKQYGVFCQCYCRGSIVEEAQPAGLELALK